MLNNPLMYVDPSGELFKEIGKWIKDNAEIITFVATVTVAVVATVATAGMASPVLAGVIVGGAAGFTAGAVGTWTRGGGFGDGLVNGLIQGSVGAVAGGIGAGVGSWASQHLGGVAIQGLNIAGPAVKGMVGGVIGGGVGGFAGGTATGLLSGESFGDALALGAKGALFGGAVGGMVGTAQGIRYAKANNLDAWSGKPNSNELADSFGIQGSIDRINRGENFPHRNDGSIFRNNEGYLPNKPNGYYNEYVHPTPGINGPGAQRIIFGNNGEIYYTPDHYRTFIRIK